MRSLAASRATLPTPGKTSSSSATRARSGGLHRLPGHSAPLPAATRQRLEQGLGQSLNGVQVDQSLAAAQWVASYPARALTIGETIYLGAEESSADLQLMGHEAAHVLQQRAGAALPQAAGGVDGGALEHEASAAGQAFAAECRARAGGPLAGHVDLVARLRPHVKTHKIPYLARMQLQAGAIGIPSQFLSMLPYLMTILALVVLSIALAISRALRAPCSALSRVCVANSLACCTVSTLRWVMLEICSREALVSSRLAACWLAPLANDWLVKDTCSAELEV